MGKNFCRKIRKFVAKVEVEGLYKKSNALSLQKWRNKFEISRSEN